MEKAFKEVGDRYLDDGARFKDWTLAHEYSLAPDLLALSHVWRSSSSEQYAASPPRAPPEAVADLCHFDPQQRSALTTQVDTIAADGQRVLGVARGTFSGSSWPASQHDFDFKFLGLIGLSDPVRPAVPAAIEAYNQAGIRVVMITGDYPVYRAARVAREIGLPESEPVTKGSSKALDDDALRRLIGVIAISVFARIVPAQKLRYLVPGAQGPRRGRRQ